MFVFFFDFCFLIFIGLFFSFAAGKRQEGQRGRGGGSEELVCILLSLVDIIPFHATAPMKKYAPLG